jgi:branched-chain amino acid transport system permease protein
VNPRASPVSGYSGATLNEFLQHLINMLVLGGTYALLGIGLTLIFGIMNVVNFTHGVLYTFGAYIMFIVVHQLGVNFFLALPLAVLAGWLLGAAIELVLLRPLRGSDIDTTMLVMIGAWIAMQSGALWIWGGVAKSVATPFPEAPLVLGPVSVSWLRLFVLAAAAMLIVVTYLLINRTKLGCAMRATFQDHDTASLMGVKVYVIFPQMGDLAAVKAFAIVILGGLGNITGAVIGGFILALAEELGAGYVSSGYRDAMGFLIIIAVLIFKPTGLFARSERVG